MANPPKPEVQWEFAPGFKASWKAYLKVNPEIKTAMTEFNSCKRADPPRELPGKMSDHKLNGPLKGFMDCHLAADVILIYKQKAGSVVKLFRVCNHGDLRGPKAKTLAKRLK